MAVKPNNSLSFIVSPFIGTTTSTSEQYICVIGTIQAKLMGALTHTGEWSYIFKNQIYYPAQIIGATNDLITLYDG